MGKIDLKKLYIVYAFLNGILAGIYALFLRGQFQGFPADLAVSLATGAVLLASILICAFAAWKWDTNTRMVKELFRVCFWTYCTLTYTQAFLLRDMMPILMVKVQPLILLILLGEGALAGVVMRYQEEESDPELYIETAQLMDKEKDPYDAFIGKLLTPFGGLCFYWMAWMAMAEYS